MSEEDATKLLHEGLRVSTLSSVVLLAHRHLEEASCCIRIIHFLHIKQDTVTACEGCYIEHLLGGSRAPYGSLPLHP